jgi:hypothetical protein
MADFKSGIDLRSPDLASKVGADVLQRLQSLDTNGDGVIKGDAALAKAWTLVDGFDRNGSSFSMAGDSKGAEIARNLQAATSSASTDGVRPTKTVPQSYSDAVNKAALNRASADKEGYAYANAPTSPYRNLSGNKTPGTSRPSWLKNNNKCNQFVGDALTQAGMKMPTFKMENGTEHYVNAERLPNYKNHFDRVTDPAQIRAGDVFVLDYPSVGESTAHTEVITGYDHATGDFKTTGAHGDGAYEMTRSNWLSGYSYNATSKHWEDTSGNKLYILRPKAPVVNTPPIRG